MKRFGKCVLNPALVLAVAPQVGGVRQIGLGFPADGYEVLFANGASLTIDRESALLLMDAIALPEQPRKAVVV